ncbi:GatB/YqeY domain-containing protein [Mangrovitalea sediminis]|uniref:GatB/YqeY domain-containing protein n=1 Tax=Mangrovitalea sediminis TaxID=1982043 RepID=UPI000BE59950|nr:GatB/YqeY domain-containing protein [Mangrovitalea sediminis]
MSEALLKNRITEAMKTAMREKDRERLGTLRLILAAIKQIEVDERIELDDARVLAVLDKMVKQRRDSAQQYSDAQRQDLADRENAEITVIQEFLPTALTADEVTAIVKDAVARSEANGMQDMGKVMALVKPEVQGRADMGDVSRIVKQILAG